MFALDVVVVVDGLASLEEPSLVYHHITFRGQVDDSLPQNIFSGQVVGWMGHGHNVLPLSSSAR